MRPLNCGRVLSVLVLILISGPGSGPGAQTPTACERLAARALPETTITAAQALTAGSFTPPGSTNAMTGLPAFCRVAGEIRPTAQSHVLFEVWMPLENWNGKYAGVGNGGWAGTDLLRRPWRSAATGLRDRVYQHRPRGGARPEHGPVRA